MGKGNVKRVVTTALVCATLSGAGIYGSYKFAANRVLENTHNNRIKIEEQVMTLKLNALYKSGGLPEDYNISEQVTNYVKNNNSQFLDESKEQVNRQVKSSVGMGMFFGALVGSILGKKSNENKKPEKTMDDRF